MVVLKAYTVSLAMPGCENGSTIAAVNSADRSARKRKSNVVSPIERRTSNCYESSGARKGVFKNSVAILEISPVKQRPQRTQHMAKTEETLSFGGHQPSLADLGPHAEAQEEEVSGQWTSDSEETPAQPHSRKRNRSQQQQALNRDAQVRYRQRKKQLAEELESQVASLQQQINLLQQQQAKRAQLLARNKVLQAAVSAEAAATELELKIARLRQTVDEIDGAGGHSDCDFLQALITEICSLREQTQVCTGSWMAETLQQTLLVQASSVPADEQAANRRVLKELSLNAQQLLGLKSLWRRHGASLHDGREHRLRLCKHDIPGLLTKEDYHDPGFHSRMLESLISTTGIERMQQIL
ncbi:hypothetical protein WJX73_010555 [Symbiochloris irregularis]|uniref:BZIP domain-containing protein n=1 Tax=Symbiochloris irregularis TaxID=706552 RepID=A0AAW1P9S1_9CHLO